MEKKSIMELMAEIEQMARNLGLLANMSTKVVRKKKIWSETAGVITLNELND